jgi:hypothetical protein
MEVMLQPGEWLMPTRGPLARLLVMGFMLDEIEIWWPLPESLSFTNSISLDCNTRQFR